MRNLPITVLILTIGKTTLLKMLLGQILPDEGSIRVLGGVPGESDVVPGSSVGYSPQVIGCILQYCSLEPGNRPV